MTMPASNISLTYVRDNMFRDDAVPASLDSPYYRDAALKGSGNVALTDFANRANGLGRTKKNSQLGLTSDVMPYHADIRVDNRESITVDTWGSVGIHSNLPSFELTAEGRSGEIPTSTYGNLWFYCERIGEQHTLNFDVVKYSSTNQGYLRYQVIAFSNGYLQGISRDLIPNSYASVGKNSVKFTPSNSSRPYILISVNAYAMGWNGFLGYENTISGSFRNIEVKI
jgi:hypothetical protein